LGAKFASHQSRGVKGGRSANYNPTRRGERQRTYIVAIKRIRTGDPIVNKRKSQGPCPAEVQRGKKKKESGGLSITKKKGTVASAASYWEKDESELRPLAATKKNLAFYKIAPTEKRASYNQAIAIRPDTKG